MSTSAKTAPAKTAKAISAPATPVAAAPKAAPTKKTIAKPAAKPASKSTAKPVTAAVKQVTKAVAKPAKVKKVKMVRDSFTMPKAEFAVLDVLKTRAANLKAPAKKTEILRAGIKALAGMSDAAFLAAVAAVPSLKTGRPAKS